MVVSRIELGVVGEDQVSTLGFGNRSEVFFPGCSAMRQVYAHKVARWTGIPRLGEQMGRPFLVKELEFTARKGHLRDK